MNFRTIIAAALVGFASLAQADNYMPATAETFHFISKVEVDNRATAYNFRVYLKDSTGAAVSNLCGNGSAYAHVNRAGNDSQWMVDQLRSARFTLTGVRLYLTAEGSGCKILVIEHN